MRYCATRAAVPLAVDTPPRPAEVLARVRTQTRLRRVFKLREEARLLHRMLPDSVITRMGRGDNVADDFDWCARGRAACGGGVAP